MKLEYPDAVPFQRATLVCRDGRLMNTAGRLLGAALFAAIGPFWWYVGAPWPAWVGCSLVALLVVPSILDGIRALYRSENWILALESAGVWINLRSYLNWHFPDAETALFVPYSEIATIRRYKMSYFVPSSEAAASQSRCSLFEIELNHSHTETIAKLLREERQRQTPRRRFLFLTIGYKVKDYPVTLPDPDKLHVTWRFYVTPSLEQVIDHLAQHVQVGDSVRQDFDDWRNLSDDEADELVRLLVESGDEIAATKLLRRRQKMSATEAKHFIDQMLSETP